MLPDLIATPYGIVKRYGYKLHQGVYTAFFILEDSHRFEIELPDGDRTSEFEIFKLVRRALAAN